MLYQMIKSVYGSVFPERQWSSSKDGFSTLSQHRVPDDSEHVENIWWMVEWMNACMRKYCMYLVPLMNFKDWVYAKKFIEMK